MTAAGAAAYRLWLAYQRRDAKITELAAWAVPSPTLPVGYIDASATLAGDGATDDTAALQAIVDARAGGETVFFPAATYRIDGPLNVPVATPIAFVGESGTIFDCTHSADPGIESDQIFRISDGAVAESRPLTRYAGFSFYGIRFEGPGIETATWMIYGNSLDALSIEYCQFNHTGRTALYFARTRDLLIAHCVFDENFATGFGYAIVLVSDCEDTVVRNNFFLTRSSNSVSVGSSVGGEHATGSDPAAWCGQVTVADNYTYGAVNAYSSHRACNGPYIVTDNVVEACDTLCQFRGATNGTTVTGNAALLCNHGVHSINTCITYDDDPCETTRPPTPVRAALDDIRGNVFDLIDNYAILTRYTNTEIDGNVIRWHTDEWSAILTKRATDTAYSIPDTLAVTNTTYSNGGTAGDALLDTVDQVTALSGNVYCPDLLAAGPAAFTVSPAVAVTGEAVAFTDATPGSPPDWEWDFGDGSGSAAQHPTHAYPTAGVYPVTLAADTTTAAQTITVVPGVSYGGVELSHADLGPIDHDPVANATDLQNGRVGLQGSPVSRRAWTINALADDRDEIEALAALKGQHAVLNINGTEYPGVMIRPPMLETQLAPATWAYQVGFIQETRR